MSLKSGGVLYPCPWSVANSTGDPLAWIPARSGGEIRVAVAHGNVEGLATLEPASLIPRDAASRYGLDYIALGHWHSTAMYGSSMAYSGTHETTGFTETDSGNILVVDIKAAGQPVTVRKVRTGALDWRSETRQVKTPGKLRSLREQIETWTGAANQLTELNISGVQYANEAGEVTRIREILRSRFLWSDVRTKLVPAPNDDSWIEALPAGPCRSAALNLRQRADAVSARALLELYTIAAEVRR